MRLFRYAPPVALAVGLAVGCAKPTASTTSTAAAPAPTAATTPTAKPTPAEDKVELTAVSAVGFEDAIRGLKGKVVLVDAWFLG